MGESSESVTALAGKHLFEALRSATFDVFLSSPYLTKDVASELASCAKTSSAQWRLLTCLNPVAIAGGFLSTSGLRELLHTGVTVRSVPRLHAKSYLVDLRFGLVGSANLTFAGLGLGTNSNAELSIVLDKSQVATARSELARWWDSSDAVDEAAISNAEATAAALPIATPVQIDPTVPDALTLQTEHLLAEARDPNRGLWIKAQYGTAHPDQWREPYWFSSPDKGRPSFKPGDLVLIYAKEAHGCYAIVEITESAVLDPGFVTKNSGGEDWIGKRWPWVNKTRPRLVPKELVVLTTSQLGVSPQALQGGHKRLTLGEFASAVRALSNQSQEGDSVQEG
ncbi:phospholipase D-like domain-containing protein [Gordonia sp. Z-3]|uniref:phospholipase D-like domain-containing protein n=1 Tax=Gordonia sp. Z-3 TaxID=3115408 RepID=UPI002E2A1B30|nr:phospholipase D-like domain-containing protein [Gordonia sp. Z-3]MED5803359.1 phospholipase D-like domain-containing protein [Gordonia sp. Z-3]